MTELVWLVWLSVLLASSGCMALVAGLWDKSVVVTVLGLVALVGLVGFEEVRLSSLDCLFDRYS